MSRLSFATFPSVRPWTVAVGLTLTLLVSGCQGGSPPSGKTSEPSTTTASPATSASVPAASATPSASAVYKPADAKGKAENVPVPVMPELAKENSKAGLEAFIGYWFQLLSYAYETGDSSSTSYLASSTCALCQHLAKSVDANYTDGRWLIGGRFRAPVAEASWDADSSSQQGRVQVIQEEIHYMDGNGTESRGLTMATNDAAAFFAKYQGGSWVVTDLGIIQ
ncbi:DUF6318 family protein [Arthrobacter sp. R3-55]